MKEFTNKQFDVTNFKPTPGNIVIDPIEKEEKSDYVATVDAADRAYKGTVVAVGDPRMTDYGETIEPPASVGDFVVYSIVGCEEFKAKKDEDLRHRYVIAPFNRVFLVLHG